MNIIKSADKLIGSTPLVELRGIVRPEGFSGMILGKAECFNLTGSIKDRAALEMLNSLEQDKTISKGSTVIEPTSGNTGISIAAIAAARGYNAIIVMPDTMSKERIKFMSAYGAKVVLTDGSKGMSGCVEKAGQLCDEIDGAVIVGQFYNPSNPMAHYKTTGPEIWQDTDGKVQVVVAGVGTGGTVSGIGKYLKKKNSEIEIVAVEPSDSQLLTKGVAGPHKIQGIGANFLPENLDMSVVDRVVSVSAEDAYRAAQSVASNDGLFVGISSGAALAAAETLLKEEYYRNKNIVVILPDSGDRYISTENFIL